MFNERECFWAFFFLNEYSFNVLFWKNCVTIFVDVIIYIQLPIELSSNQLDGNHDMKFKKKRSEQQPNYAILRKNGVNRICFWRHEHKKANTGEKKEQEHKHSNTLLQCLVFLLKCHFSSLARSVRSHFFFHLVNSFYIVLSMFVEFSLFSDKNHHPGKKQRMCMQVSLRGKLWNCVH